MTEQRAPQDHARELANGIIDGVMASVDRNGELYDRWSAVDTVMKLIAEYTAPQLAGAVPQEELRELIADMRRAELCCMNSRDAGYVIPSVKAANWADELESLIEKRRST